VLPARYRMTRSAEFGSTVKNGVQAVEPDIVVHATRCDHASCDHASCDQDCEPGPRIGLVVGKSVGSAVQRHQVARRLRHVARSVITELDPGDRIVIRALPGSRHAMYARLEQELRAGLTRARMLPKERR
jgi:ribonuclease P protein component